MTKKERKIIEMVLKGTGVTINGTKPWDPQINDEAFYGRVLSQGSLGLGEAYMDNQWECEQMDEFINRLLRVDVRTRLSWNLPLITHLILCKLTNRQSKSRAFTIGEAHYDNGNDLYKAMLDKRMTYTGAYWKDVDNLDDAQEAKLDMVCRKLGLKQGDKVLDIGCGWGSFMKFAAERYGVRCVGVTVSKEQVELGRKLCNGLDVEFRLQDYRDVNETFDHVMSLGMIEHVGVKNLRSYMKVASRCLKDDGLFLLQSIGSRISSSTNDPWMEKYIFPNSMLPSCKQLAQATEGIFVMEDWHNFGVSYEKTLLEWFKNFDKAWPKLRQHYSERFYRMWKFYLLSCAGLFRSRRAQLWQIVYSKNGVLGGYNSIRINNKRIAS